MKDNREVVYLKHPVTPAQKAEVLAQGKKIIDIRFMPPGLKAKVEEKPAEKPAAKKAKFKASKKAES